jgi:hypothetical protein
MGPATPEEVAAAEYLRQKPGDEVVAARAAALAKRRSKSTSAITPS